MHPVETLLTPLGKLFRNRHADESRSVSHHPALATANRIGITSPSFADGHEIPSRHCGRFIGDNVSPALVWSPLPADTVDVLLIMEDLDSPGQTPRLHAVAAFAPRPTGLPEGALGIATSDVRFLNDGKKPLSYAGPRPLPGHGPHHYRIHLYALDQRVDMDAAAGVDELAAAVNGHVLAAGMLTGIRES